MQQRLIIISIVATALFSAADGFHHPLLGVGICTAGDDGSDFIFLNRSFLTTDASENFCNVNGGKPASIRNEIEQIQVTG